MTPGRYYAYTLPLRCGSPFIFDGKRWLFIVPANVQRRDMVVDVWMLLRSPTLLITHSDVVSGASGEITIGFEPYRGQTPATACLGLLAGRHAGGPEPTTKSP